MSKVDIEKSRRCVKGFLELIELMEQGTEIEYDENGVPTAILVNSDDDYMETVSKKILELNDIGVPLPEDLKEKLKKEANKHIFKRTLE